jgi:hypothetical protein
MRGEHIARESHRADQPPTAGTDGDRQIFWANRFGISA